MKIKILNTALFLMCVDSLLPQTSAYPAIDTDTTAESNAHSLLGIDITPCILACLSNTYGPECSNLDCVVSNISFFCSSGEFLSCVENNGCLGLDIPSLCR